MQSVYHPRRPEASPLWRLLDNHYDNFERCYEERFEQKCGFFRPIIREVVQNYLTCGNLKNGFCLGTVYRYAALSICLPLVAKAVGFALPVIAKRLFGSEDY